MDYTSLVKFLRDKSGYLKSGPYMLARKFGMEVDVCRDAIETVKSEIKHADHNKVKNMKVLIYDIETSYNIVSSWRIGNKVNLPHHSVIKERAIICVSYKWLGEDQVYNLTWDRNQDDKFLLENFIEVMNEADILVAHNGDRFDLKWIRTRALKHGLEMLPYYQQHDTIKTAKKYFNFNSNKLDYITQFLGFEGKIKTEPELWDRVILDKDMDALKEMVFYCDEDVRQLEKVYLKILNWDKPKQHAGVLMNRPKHTSPYSGSRNLKWIKKRTTGMGTVKHIMKDLDTGCTFEMSNASYQNYVKEKKHDT